MRGEKAHTRTRRLEPRLSDNMCSVFSFSFFFFEQNYRQFFFIVILYGRAKKSKANRTHTQKGHEMFGDEKETEKDHRK